MRGNKSRRSWASATKVPRPWLRTRRPFWTSSARAWRTVMRLIWKRSQSSRSEGSRVSGGHCPESIASSMAVRSWK